MSKIEFKQELGKIREYETLYVENLRQGDIFITVNNGSVLYFRLYLGMKQEDVQKAIKYTQTEYKDAYLETYKNDYETVIHEVEEDLKLNCTYYAVTLFGLDITHDKEYLLGKSFEILDEMMNNEYCIKFDNTTVDKLNFRLDAYRVGKIEKEQFNLWLLKLKFLNPDIDIDFIENDVNKNLLEDMTISIARGIKSIRETVLYDVLKTKIPLMSLPKKRLRVYCYLKEPLCESSRYVFCYVTYSFIRHKYAVKRIKCSYMFSNDSPEEELSAFNNLYSDTDFYVNHSAFLYTKANYIKEEEMASKNFFIVNKK